jgi:hypothetical protein
MQKHIQFLCDQVYSSPLISRQGNFAFQYPRTQNIWHKTVPEDPNIMITHVHPTKRTSYLGLCLGCDFFRELFAISWTSSVKKSIKATLQSRFEYLVQCLHFSHFDDGLGEDQYSTQALLIIPDPTIAWLPRAPKKSAAF